MGTQPPRVEARVTRDLRGGAPGLGSWVWGLLVDAGAAWELPDPSAPDNSALSTCTRRRPLPAAQEPVQRAVRCRLRQRPCGHGVHWAGRALTL